MSNTVPGKAAVIKGLSPASPNEGAKRHTGGEVDLSLRVVLDPDPATEAR